ncbi:MAG: family 78 glycoside hydrolase catalytic domain [Clostridia bacterium]
MGLTVPPQLGWRLESNAQNVRQSACRVQLSQDLCFDAPLWDSGELAREDSAHYRPEALPLESARRYWWRVWVRAGAMEAWSEPATFVTGLLEGFACGFITAEGDGDADSDKGTAVSTAFEVQGEVEAVYAYATALGVYHLWLDGERVDDTELSPGWTSYRHRVLYQTYDLTARFTHGRHSLCAWLGSGWYKGLMGFCNMRNHYGDRTAFLCQIEIRYRDGRKERIVTDESWRGADTPVLFADIYNGESYDARLGMHHERAVHALPGVSAALVPQAGCAARIIETLPVRALLTTPKGETVLDFGQNLTGFVRFRVPGQCGDTVELQCFEALDKDGNVYTANLRSAKQTIRYTVGEEEGFYQPHFTFQGFRYVHVKAWPGRVNAESFTACVVHSDMRPIGSFSCSHPLINQLWHNITWGLKGNFLDVPTDCPQRDERLGWSGDAQIFSATACYLMDADAFYRKWLADLAADQTPEGGVGHVIPDLFTNLAGRADGSLLEQGTHSAAAWADAAVIIPWNLYLAYGDVDVLRVQYPSMKKWVEFMRAHATGGLWAYRLQFGDWVALDAPQEGSCFGATPNELVAAAYYAYSTELLAKTAQTLGLAEDAAEYRALHGAIVSDFQHHFYTEAGELTVQTQTAHVLALHFGLAPAQWREQTLCGLKRLLAERGGHLVTGFVGTPYIAHALSDNGALAEAYELVLKQDFPSWLYQVTMGATTVWEHWDGIKPDGSMWSEGMNSFNHYAYGAIGEWLYKVIGGIHADESCPGYRHALLAPQPGGGLSEACAELETAYGLLSVRWRIAEGQLYVTAVIPCNTTATLRSPADGTEELLPSGTHERSFAWL